MACALAQAEPHRLEFLYINANEGTASGGHAALRFDRDVYHFQHVPPGLLRITRDDFPRFRTLYGDAENRSIFAHRIAVSEDTWQFLRDGFNRRLLIEDEHFGQLEGLERDMALLRQQLEQTGKPQRTVEISLKGAGLFAPPQTGHPGPAVTTNTASAGLRERIRAKLGQAAFDGLGARLRDELAQLQALDELPDPASLDVQRFQPARYGYAERFLDRLGTLHAWQVLMRAAPLQPGALLRPRGPEFALSPARRAGLLAFRNRLENALAALPAASHRQWGYALLVGMARLAAIDATLAEGRLMVLNLAVEGGPQGLRREDVLQRAQKEFASALAGLETASEVDERAYGRLERSANLLIHAGNPSLRADDRLPLLSLLPQRPAPVRAIASHMPTPQLAGQLARLEAAAKAYRDRLAELYPYHLITANCVSELFRSVDAILASGGAAGGPKIAAAESRRRLGGHVDPGFPNSIPFVAFRAVAAHWNLAETYELPSWRHRKLQDARNESGWLADVRESNVLSASLYRWHPEDAAFLVFTDAQPWLGLLGGPVNAAIGLGQGVAGLATLPWDAGRNLRQGAKGFLISLPETVFFGIRKGSYPEHRSGIAGLSATTD